MMSYNTRPSKTIKYVVLNTLNINGLKLDREHQLSEMFNSYTTFSRKKKTVMVTNYLKLINTDETKDDKKAINLKLWSQIMNDIIMVQIKK